MVWTTATRYIYTLTHLEKERQSPKAIQHPHQYGEKLIALQCEVARECLHPSFTKNQLIPALDAKLLNLTTQWLYNHTKRRSDDLRTTLNWRLWRNDTARELGLLEKTDVDELLNAVTHSIVKYYYDSYAQTGLPLANRSSGAIGFANWARSQALQKLGWQEWLTKVNQTDQEWQLPGYTSPVTRSWVKGFVKKMTSLFKVMLEYRLPAAHPEMLTQIPISRDWLALMQSHRYWSGLQREQWLDQPSRASVRSKALKTPVVEAVASSSDVSEAPITVLPMITDSLQFLDSIEQPRYKALGSPAILAYYDEFKSRLEETIDFARKTRTSAPGRLRPHLPLSLTTPLALSLDWAIARAQELFLGNFLVPTIKPFGYLFDYLRVEANARESEILFENLKPFIRKNNENKNNEKNNLFESLNTLLEFLAYNASIHYANILVAAPTIEGAEKLATFHVNAIATTLQTVELPYSIKNGKVSTVGLMILWLSGLLPKPQHGELRLTARKSGNFYKFNTHPKIKNYQGFDYLHWLQAFKQLLWQEENAISQRQNALTPNKRFHATLKQGVEWLLSKTQSPMEPFVTLSKSLEIMSVKDDDVIADVQRPLLGPKSKISILAGLMRKFVSRYAPVLNRLSPTAIEILVMALLQRFIANVNQAYQQGALLSLYEKSPTEITNTLYEYLTEGSHSELDNQLLTRNYLSTAEIALGRYQPETLFWTVADVLKPHGIVVTTQQGWYYCSDAKASNIVSPYGYHQGTAAEAKQLGFQCTFYVPVAPFQVEQFRTQVNQSLLARDTRNASYWHRYTWINTTAHRNTIAHEAAGLVALAERQGREACVGTKYSTAQMLQNLAPRLDAQYWQRVQNRNDLKFATLTTKNPALASVEAAIFVERRYHKGLWFMVRQAKRNAAKNMATKTETTPPAKTVSGTQNV